MSKITNLTGGAVTIIVAATKKGGGGWDHFYLGNGQDTSRLTDDPDGFACYDSSTGKLVKIIYEGGLKFAWRLHDWTTIEVKQNNSGNIEAFTSFSFKLCAYYGRWPFCHILRKTGLESDHYDFPESL